jgi:transposase
MVGKGYPDDLSDIEWALIKEVLPENKEETRGRPLKHTKREMLNAIFYLLRTGCSWRHLPHAFPPWKSVYTQFLRWREQGVYEKLVMVFRDKWRGSQGRSPRASGCIVDSQTVKTTEKGDQWL